MVVTIDNYRGAAEPKAGAKDKQDNPNFTVAMAGYLKMELQALNKMLTRTPVDQHGELLFEVILRSKPPGGTYVSGSEELYFLVKTMPWPQKIPTVFVNAYKEVLQSRPFTNKYTPKCEGRGKFKYHEPLSITFLPTFSTVRLLLPEIDALCNTSLSDIFRNADDRLRSFPFMRLPVELRLHVYDYLVPNEPLLVRIRSKELVNKASGPPKRLDIMRVSRALYQETTKHFFRKSTLLIEVCEEWRRVEHQFSFTKRTAQEYATLIRGISADIRRNFTRLEIRIVSGMPDMNHNIVHEKLHTSPLRQICAALFNLAVVVISFERAEEWSKPYAGLPAHEIRRNHFNSLTRTLEWVYAQLPDENLRVSWDLTHLRDRFDNAAQLRQIAMSEWMIRELMEREGSLELAQSVTATRADRRKWSEMREMVLEAVQ
ncbi:3 exoribonuclease family protein [Stagonosporopsis vannaccii]|nr:3 exoribonuclease family protein [Stagonosporopsis vannaccii]